MVEPIDFFVKGSSPDPYRVSMVKVQGRFLAGCTCPAGTFGQVCKHVLRIIKGDDTGIISGNAAGVAHIPALVEGTEIPYLIDNIREHESMLENAKRALKVAKVKLAKSLYGKSTTTHG